MPDGPIYFNSMAMNNNNTLNTGAYYTVSPGRSRGNETQIDSGKHKSETRQLVSYHLTGAAAAGGEVRTSGRIAVSMMSVLGFSNRARLLRTK